MLQKINLHQEQNAKSAPWSYWFTGSFNIEYHIKNILLTAEKLQLPAFYRETEVFGTNLNILKSTTHKVKIQFLLGERQLSH